MRGRLLALAGGLLLVAGVEGVLHLFPGLGPPPLTIRLGASPETGALRQLNPLYARRFFAGDLGGHDLGGTLMTPHRFADPPPASALRVVVVGASTVQGYPHPARLAAPAFLQTLLGSALRQPVQVINLGITSVASFAVARVVDDALAELQPQLVVVYTGHNEFFGVYGVAALRQGGPAPWSRHLHYRASGTRLAGLTRWSLGRLRPRAAPDSNLIQVLGAVDAVPAAHPARRRAVEQLTASLEEIVAACRRAGAQVVLCTPVSNDAGYVPADSAAAALATRARQAADGRPADAVAAFAAARDADPMPWRAPTGLLEAVRQVAARRRVPLADAATALAAAEGPVGWNLMVDHVHPTPRGHARLARVVVDALVSAAEPLVVPADWRVRAPSDTRLLAAHGALPVERFAVAREMARFLGGPPLRQTDRAAVLQRQADSLWSRLGVEERAGYETWLRLARRPPLVLTVADKLFENNRLLDASEHYRATRLEAAYTPWGDLWPALRRARSLLAVQGSLTAAQRHEIEEARQRAALVALAPDADAAFLQTFSEYARRLLASPSGRPREERFRDP